MSELHNIITEEYTSLLEETRHLVNEITRKYILRITCYVCRPGSDNSVYTYAHTAAVDTKDALEQYVNKEVATAQKTAEYYTSNSASEKYEASVYASYRRVDCIITPNCNNDFLKKRCGFTYASYQNKFVWYADEDIDGCDVALDTPEREIHNIGGAMTDSGWRTQREQRRQAKNLDNGFEI
ncbi:MAG: hypothetical protein IKI93_14285 [Clostridia bacterium]|nr:hypothetical protein [Clostridia bacterium]